MPDRAPNTPLLVFADDWGRHPSSCQHLIARLLPQHQVLWVNTIGTRPPRLDVATFRRGMGKMRQWLKCNGAPATHPTNLRVLNPIMWPWLGSAFHRKLNRSLLVRQLRAALEELPEPPIAITTVPVAADLVGLLPVQRWVYYCVDDFGQWPGLDGAALAGMERRLIQLADQLIAAGPNLRDRLVQQGRDAAIVSHGVDLDFWQNGHAGTLAWLDAVERPLVVFWGLVDRRLNVEWLERLARDLTAGTIVLAGPHNDFDPRLRGLPRTMLPGNLPHEHLPILARAADILIMPYADLPVTRAMQPLKLKEYLATGKPVVACDLPATREWADCLERAVDSADFSNKVLAQMRTGLPEEQMNARRRLRAESWEAKSAQFQHLLRDGESAVARCS